MSTEKMPSFRIHLNQFIGDIDHVVVFLDEVGDVLAGGLAQPFPFFADPLMQVDGDLGTQVFGGCHSRIPPSFFVTQAYSKDSVKAITNTTKE